MPSRRLLTLVDRRVDDPAASYLRRREIGDGSRSDLHPRWAHPLTGYRDLVRWPRTFTGSGLLLGVDVRLRS